MRVFRGALGIAPNALFFLNLSSHISRILPRLPTGFLVQQPAFPQRFHDVAGIEGLSLVIRFQHQRKDLAVCYQEEIVYCEFGQGPAQRAIVQKSRT